MILILMIKKLKITIVVQFPDSLNGERVGHTSSLYFAILEIVNLIL